MSKLPNHQGVYALRTQNAQALLIQSGQALLIVVLSLAVVLTVVLSILARSVTDIKISTGGEESLRAFSAAEAGIETSLNSLIIGESSGDLGGATFTASVTEVGEGSDTFASPASLFSGETSTFWFVAHDASGNLVCDLANNCFTGTYIDVCWGKDGTASGAPDTPAMEAAIVYATTAGNYATLRIARETADPYSARSPANSFSAVTDTNCTIGQEIYEFRKRINFSTIGIDPPGAANYADDPNELQFMVVRLLYNQSESHSVGIATSGELLPAQGNLVESLGTSGEANRKISVFQGFGEPPLPLGAVIFSPAGITK